MMALQSVPTENLASIETEAALLGGLMSQNDAIDAVADTLAAEHFFEPVHGRIYSAIVKEASLGRPANPLTVKSYFHDDNAIAELGGISYLAKLTGTLSMAMPVRDCARQIKELAERRVLVERLTGALEIALNPSASNDTVLDAADEAVTSISGTTDGIAQMDAGQAFDRMIAAYVEPRHGVQCVRIESLDNLLGPIRPKQLIIGAGRPGMGKTAVALSYSIGAALNGHGVLFVSLEMSADELAARMASDMCFDGHSGVPFEAIRDGRLDQAAMRRVVNARDRIAEAPFRIIDAGSLSVGRLAMIVRRYKRRFAAQGRKLELVVIDYLQLLHPDTKGRSAYESVSEVSRSLKAIAKDYDVGVLALAQLSRAVEQRQDKQPILSDLRDSGQIEQDADAVLFLYRHEYYLRQAEPENDDEKHAIWEQQLEKCRGRLDLILAKRRNGRTGKAQAVFWTGNQAVRG
jgi:replicative DNA helicase